MNTTEAKKCLWKEQDHDGDMPGTWDTACGTAWYVEEGTPEESGFHFCPNCGKKPEFVFFVEIKTKNKDRHNRKI